MSAKNELSKKTIAITGVSEGLGYKLCKTYLGFGSNVFACSRNIELAREKFSKYDNKNLLLLKADVSIESDMENFFKAGINKFGVVDVLINNAGIYGPKGNIDNVDWLSWIDALKINLFGQVYATRLVLHQMKKQNKGKIIQLSGGGATNPMPNLSAYAVSKAAIVRFVETVALEVKNYNIDFNAIAPGPLNTRLLDEILEAGPKLVGEEFYKKSIEQKKNGGVSLEHAIELCIFLSSKESDGISGKLISAIWDNWNNWKDHKELLKKSDIYSLRRITGKDRGFDWGDK